MSDDPLQTISPDQVPVVSAMAEDAFVFVQRPGGPIQKIAQSSLLSKLIATDLVKSDEAELQADLAHDENMVALVINDPDPLKSGWYRKVGASGAGNWQQFEQLSMAVRQDIDLSGGRAQAWAESTSPPDPDDPTSESAKTIAERVGLALANLGLIQTSNGVSMLDGDGNVVWRIGADGVMQNLEYQQTREKANEGSAIAASIEPDANFSGFSVRDPNGAMGFKVDKAGKVVNRHIASVETAGRRALSLAQRQRDAAQRAYALLVKLAHILLYGQSLAMGTATSKTFLNYATMPWAKMFQGGLRERNAYPTAYVDVSGSTVPVSTYNANFRAGLVTAKEANETDGGTAYGETGLLAAMEMVAQLLLEEDGIDIASMGQQFLLSTCAEGQTRIANLAAGSQNYQRIIDSAAAAKALAAAAGTTPYGLAAVLYRQMERDIALGTPPATFTAAWRALLTSIRGTYAAATGIDKPFPCIAYQTDGHRHYGMDASLTSAVYDWICAQADVALSCPIYMLPSVDNIHRDHFGYLRIGAYEGVALKRWLFDEVKPRHLQPGAPIWTPNAIVLPFDVPVGQLTVDTAAVSDPGSWGASLVDETATARPVTGVEVLGDNLIVRYDGADLAPTSQLRLGWGDNAHPTGGPTTGSRICLRDQQGNQISYRGYAMHNWAPICARTRT